MAASRLQLVLKPLYLYLPYFTVLQDITYTVIRYYIIVHELIS